MTVRDGEPPDQAEGNSGKAGPAEDAVESDIDRLYQCSLGEFIEARNQLAGRLAALDRNAAARIRKLPKPSVSAWAVNQAYWNARSDFDALLDAGEIVRGAQRKALGGESAEDLQSAIAARLRAMARVQKHAEDALDRAGHAANQAIVRRVSTTLEALAAYGRAASAPPSGRLSTDVPAPGFEAVAELARDTPAAAREHSVTTAAMRRANERRERRGSDGVPSANDNEPARILDVLARRAQKRSLESVAAAQARVDAEKRALGQAERAESAALEHMYETRKQVTLAQERLSMAITAHSDSERAVDRAKLEVQKKRASLASAEAELATAQQRLNS